MEPVAWAASTWARMLAVPGPTPSWDVKKDLGAATNVLRVEPFARAVDEIRLRICSDGDRSTLIPPRTGRSACPVPGSRPRDLYPHRWADIVFGSPTFASPMRYARR